MTLKRSSAILLLIGGTSTAAVLFAQPASAHSGKIPHALPHETISSTWIPVFIDFTDRGNTTESRPSIGLGEVVLGGFAISMDGPATGGTAVRGERNTVGGTTAVDGDGTSAVGGTTADGDDSITAS